MTAGTHVCHCTAQLSTSGVAHGMRLSTRDERGGAPAARLVDRQHAVRLPRRRRPHRRRRAPGSLKAFYATRGGLELRRLPVARARNEV